MRWTVKRRLMLLGAVTALGLTVLVGLVVTMTGRLQGVLASGDVFNQTIHDEMDAARLHEAIRGDVYAYLAAGADADRASATRALGEHTSRLVTALTSVRGQVTIPAIADRVDAAAEHAASYVAAARDVVAAGAAGAAARLPAFHASYADLEERLPSISREVAADARAATGEVAGSAALLRRLVLAVGAVLFVAIVLLSHGVGTRVTKSLARTREVLRAVAGGDLTIRLQTSGNDEFADLAEGLDATVGALQHELGQVSVAATEVTMAVTEIARSNRSVAQGSTQQASTLQETAASIEELSVMTKQNAGSTSHASELAASASDSTAAGASSVHQMSEAMGRIQAAATATAAIISDINEIAFQTNLLSLNAAVEAARAGDAGRGFAVVAEEVRMLALRCKDAARNTEQLIRESVGLTTDGERVARETEETLTRAREEVARVSSLIADIASANDEQARGIEHLNRSVTQMDLVTQRSAKDAEASAAAASEVASRAEQLTALVGRYRLGEAAAPRPAAGPKGGGAAVEPHGGREPMVNGHAAGADHDLMAALHDVH